MIHLTPLHQQSMSTEDHTGFMEQQHPFKYCDELQSGLEPWSSAETALRTVYV